MTNRLLFLIPLLFVTRGPLAHAEFREQLGRLQVDNLILRPQFRMVEPASGNFSMGESLFAVRWQMDPRIGAVFSVGSKELVGQSARYSSQIQEELSFVEAYGEFEGDYGLLRAGLQPVQFGLEGTLPESTLDMQRSLLFQRRVVPLRDIGLSYEIEHNQFGTRVFVHNGESDRDSDGRMWYTASWWWEQRGRLQVGMAGQTGSTKAIATSSSSDTLAGVDVNKEALWRLGGPYVQWTPPSWRISLEAYVGDLVQDAQTRKFSALHVDLSYEARQLGYLFRYDQFDPNHSQTSDRVHQVSLGLEWLSQRRTSRLILVGTKSLEEGREVPNDELRLIWHLTPQLPQTHGRP